MLEIEDVHAYYGDMQALAGVTMRVAKGEIVTVLGSNGAGKSTLMKVIAGMIPIRSGSVRLAGEVVTGLSTEDLVKRGLTYVPEGRELFPNLSVRDNLLVGALHRSGAQRAVALKEVIELFPFVGQRLSQKVGTLSGGEQQMVAIGRALMSSPRLALVDEMTLGVAPIVAARLFNVMRELRDRGTTLVLVEQNANEALAVASRGYVLETGSVVLSGDAQDLIRNPKIRQAYLGLGVEAPPEAPADAVHDQGGEPH